MLEPSHRASTRYATVFNPPPPIIGPDRSEVIYRIRLVAGQMEPAFQANFECFSDRILNAGAKQHADIQVLGAV